MNEKVPFRILPELSPENAHFWKGGADGELRILRCDDCGLYLHPPGPVCPRCRSERVAPEAVSGLGTVLTHTVNVAPWIPGFDPPYVIAIVHLDEQADLRLTTQLVNVEPAEVVRGLRVRVRFEKNGDVWLPLFEPSDAPATTGPGPATPSRPARAPSDRRGERLAAISGLGQSRVGRKLGADPLALTVEACLGAIDDAGLTPEDVDGISTYPGEAFSTMGFSGPGVVEVQDALRLKLNWFSGGPETPGQLGAVFNACAAVAAGLARHVLCFRTVWESSARSGLRSAGLRAPGPGYRASGFMQWNVPFGAASAANWIAMFAQAHVDRYGTTREQLAQIALNARRNAALNERAVYREPLTLDAYLDARMISTPLGLFDCDVPVDGSTAILVSDVNAAADCAKPRVRVEAIGSALHGRPSWDQFDDLTTMAMRDAAAMMWNRTSLRPSDVHVAELYDGFSFLALAWLEALGFCGEGEGGPFVEGGERIALDGELPLNTQGGQLSAGRLHGFGMLHEAVLQLRGQAGTRQVAGAPQVAVASAGGGPLGGCMLLVRD